MVRVTPVTQSTSVSHYRAYPLPTPLELVATMEVPTLPMMPESIQGHSPCTREPHHFSGFVWHPTWRSTWSLAPALWWSIWKQIYILTITSTTQLENLECWLCEKKPSKSFAGNAFKIGILKRNFKMWLQTSPYNTPGLPYGKIFAAVDYDMTWKEVSWPSPDFHMIKDIFTFVPHHSESTQEWDEFPFTGLVLPEDKSSPITCWSSFMSGEYL